MSWLNLPYKSGGWRRSLSADEDDVYAEHLLRLPPEDRRSRFMHQMSDDAIREHARNHGPSNRRVIGWFRDGVLRGAVELDFFEDEAEAAVTVEPEYRGLDVARGLMHSALRAASNRGVRKVIVRTAGENKPMLHLARSVGAHFHIEEGELTGEIDAEAPTPVSFIFDCAEERSGMFASLMAAAASKFKAPWQAAGDKPGAPKPEAP